MAATGVHAQTPKQPTLQIPVSGISTSSGCYSSYANMTMHKPISADRMSTASCIIACRDDGFWLAAMHGGQCLCGFALPPKKDLVDDSQCNQPCPAYPPEACGGLESYSIYNVGTQLQINRYDPASSSSAGGSSNAASPTSPQPSPPNNGGGGATIIETAVTTEPPSSQKGGPSVAGIAAGVVVGVVAAAAIIGGVLFFFKRKRNSEIEEEHRRNAAVNAFISGSKPPSSHGSISMTDSRLDPVIAHRRMSDGSIADNEDYSRRILRVTNA
ncbi:hypothetical protein E4U42_004573 [Claviceps africana]|uniref:WSC domain-containing protein n=1 Tax=Claviceps africana TaxID=83212 RepID=A0A8K0J5G7_9HYPO|nr:hypothetical protein E4U42_004573 [Claviceps africana]